MGHHHRRGQPASVILILTCAALLAPTGYSAPLSSQSQEALCSPTCRQSRESSKFKYEEGKTYSYTFETEVITKLTGTTDEQSKIRITGDALIAAKSPCEFVLTVQRTKISGRSRQITEGLSALEGSSLRFAFQDGTIEGVCVDQNDPSWSANIKRGLASMLQNKALNTIGDGAVMEIDVSGRCLTTYTSSGTTYTKTRDLNSCTHRDGGFWILQGTPYHISSEKNSIPLVNSTHTCEQTFDGVGVIKNVRCTETHKLAAISSDQGGAETGVVAKMNLRGAAAGIPTVRSSLATSPSSILYDHSQKDVSGATARIAQESTDQVLADICLQTKTGTVTAAVPGLIHSLRRTIRGMKSVEHLTALYDKISGGKLCSNSAPLEKIFKDTAARAGTTESIAFMAQLIAQGKVDKTTQTVFSVYTSFASKPDTPALAAFTALIGKSEVDPDVILSASGLAHRYCREVNRDCGANEDYVRLVKTIAQIGRESCMGQEEKAINLAVSSLQALGNVDNLPTEVVGTILECMKSSNRIKMTALEAFRRDPCQAQLKTQAFEMLKNTKMSSELRIQAYLAVTRCAKQEDVKEIQRILDTEMSNQVGSFISSHVANILASPSPTKREIRAAFKQLRLSKDFPNDPRKFSTNFDFTTFSATRNLGISVENNILYSQDSFLPRAATTKLDGQFFGRSYNFLEMGIYLEDFEHILEKFFGPSGKLATSSRNELTSEAREHYIRFKNEIQSRFRRDISSSANLEAINDKHSRATTMKERFGSNGLGNFYIRHLETTVLSTTFTQDQLREQFLSKNFFAIFDKLIAGAKDHNIELTEPFTFLNDEFVIPTVSGLPLNLELEGTTVLSLQLNGKLDIPSLLKRDANSDVRMRVLPSAATTIRAKMSVGAGPVESGLQFEGKVHTASGVDLAITRQDGKFEMKLNLPEDKVQVLSLRSELFWVEAERLVMKETPLISKFASKRDVSPFCTLLSAVGLRLCAQVQIPEYAVASAPAFPLAGDAAFGFYVEKIEPSMEGYYVKVDTSVESEAEKRISFVFDTPGSITNRKISGAGRYVKGRSPKVDLDMNTPTNNLKMEYQQWNEESVKGVDMKLMRNGAEYSTSAKMAMTKIGSNGMSYEPILSYTSPEKSVKLVEGKVTREFGKQLDVDIRYGQGLDTELRGTISGTVKIQREDERNAEFSLSNLQLECNAFGKLGLDGTGTLKENKKALRLNAKYGKDVEHDLTVDGEFSKPSPKATKFALAVSSSRRSFLNFDVNYNSARTVNGFENTLLVHRGADDESKFTLSQSANYNFESNKIFDIKNLVEVTYPKRGINFYLKGNAKNGAEQMGDFELRMGSDVSATVKYGATGTAFSDYDLKGILKFPGQKLEFSENAKKLDSSRWKYTTAFSSKRDGKSPFTFTADTDMMHKFERDDTQSEITSKITTSAYAEPFELSSNVVSRKEFYQAHLKLKKTSGDILNLASEYRRGIGSNPSKFSSKAFLLTYLDASLEETHGRGSSNFKMDATWIPTGRKIVGISDLRKQGDQYNLDASAQWDASRDASQSATIKSVTTPSSARTGVSLESANKIGFLGKTYDLNVGGKLSFDYFNGENSANFVYTSSHAPGRTYALKMKHVNENRDSSRRLSTLGASLTLPDQKPIEFELINRASNIDLAKYVFEYSSDLKVNYQGNKNVNFLTEVKSLFTNKRSFSALVDVSGSAISQPMKVDFRSDLQRGNIRTVANAKYGQKDGNFDFALDYDRWQPKKTVDLKYKMSSTIPALRNLETNFKLAYLFTSLTNFEYAESGSFSINNGIPTTWDNGISYLNNDFLAKYNIHPEGQPLVSFSTKGVIGAKKVTFKVQNILRGGSDVKINVDADRNWPNMRFTIGLTSPYAGYEKLDLTLRHKVGATTGHNYVTQIQGSANNEAVTLTSKIDFNEAKKMVEFAVTDKRGVMKVSASVNGLNTNNYNVDTMVVWGEKFISTKGNLLRSGSSLEGDLTLHSPVLKADNWNIKVSNILSESGSGGNVLSFHVHSAQKEQASLVIEYAKKDGAFLSTFDGSVAVRFNDGDWGGTFQLEDKSFTFQRDKEEGRGVTLTLQLKSEKYPVKIVFGGKRSTVENVYSASFCTEGDLDCKKGEVTYKKISGEEGSGFELSGIAKSTTDGKTLLDGIVVKNLVKYNEAKRQETFFEYSARLLTSGGDADDDEQHTLGYKIFQNLDIAQPKTGIEIYLPERELGILYTVKSTAVDEILLEAWLDRLRKPDEKLTLSVVYDKRDMYTVLLKHPALKKDLQVRSRVQTNQNGFLIDTTTDLDFFKGTQPLSLIFKVKKGSHERSLSSSYGIDLGLKGLVSLSAHSDITVGGGELLTKTQFEYLNREEQKRNYNFVLDYGFNHRTLELVGPEGRVVMYSSRYTVHSIPGTNQYDGYEVRRELFLPGMADSRIFQNSISTSFPPSAHLKMYTANSGSGESYEAWIGFKNDQQFTAGLYANEGMKQGVIADFNLALNNTRLLFVKTTWDKQNVKAFLEKSNDRLTDTAIRFKRMQVASADYLGKEASHVRTVITKALPNLKPVIKFYSVQLTQLEEELGDSKVMNHYLRHYFEFFLNILGTDIEEFKRQIGGIKQSFTDATVATVKMVESIPELINRGIDGIPKMVEAFQKGMSITLDALLDASRTSLKFITDAFESVTKNNPTIANQVEYLSDTSKGIGKFLKEALIETLQQMTQVWKSLKSSTEDFLDSEIVRDYVKYYATKYQQLVVDAIAEYKKDFDSFRESIFKALPEQEFQELLQSVSEYVEKKTRQEQVDDEATQAEIYKKFVKAIRKIKSNVLTVDLKNGLIIAQVPLPMPVKSLTEMDDAFALVMASHKFKTPSYSYSIREVYNQIRTPSGIRDLLPPFKATGLLIGSQYYKTFDDKFYHFEGKCNYVLASDFVDKNFTIVIAYIDGAEAKKAITLTDHKDSITIQADHSVLVNGRVSSVPASAGDLKVEKLKDWNIARGRGFSVACSTIQDVCAVKISGFYQGKTNGLLGTYNNEKFDDMNSPSGEIMESVAKMAETWKLGQCTEKPLPVYPEPTAQEKCTNAFTGRSSELRPCFGVVSPSSYQSTCDFLSQVRRYDANRAVCTASFAYQTMCGISGVRVEDSGECL